MIQWKIYSFDIYKKGDLEGYMGGHIHFHSEDESYNYLHEFLFRIKDDENGDPMTIVSIEYGFKVEDIEDMWQNIESAMCKIVTENNLKKKDGE